METTQKSSKWSIGTKIKKIVKTIKSFKKIKAPQILFLEGESTEDSFEVVAKNGRRNAVKGVAKIKVKNRIVSIKIEDVEVC